MTRNTGTHVTRPRAGRDQRLPLTHPSRIHSSATSRHIGEVSLQVVPAPTGVDRFDQLALDPALLRAVRELKYERPTPIQARAIPIVLGGKDLLGCAQTGTGK